MVAGIAAMIGRYRPELADPVVLIEVLWAINAPEAERLGVTPEKFGPRCLVDQNPIFVDLMEQVKSFFSQLGQRRKLTALSEMLRKSQEIVALVGDPEIEKAELELMRQKFDKLKAKLEASRTSGTQATEPTSTS